MRGLKRVTSRGIPEEPEEDTDSGPQYHYDPPTVTYLGTLRDLTLGGTTGPSDAVGGTGGSGSL
jgi:hypothetical protein